MKPVINTTAQEEINVSRRLRRVPSGNYQPLNPEENFKKILDMYNRAYNIVFMK